MPKQQITGWKLIAELGWQAGLAIAVYGLLWAGFGTAAYFQLTGLTFRGLAIVFGLLSLGLISSLVFSVFPRGEDFVFIRLGLAAICRTILPLVILVFIGYTDATEFDLRAHLIPILIGYFVALVFTISSAVRVGQKMVSQ